MGRGLSPLQKAILTLAHRKVGRPTDPALAHLGADVRYEDVRREHYGLSRSTPATSVSITKAVWRLAERGLVVPMTAAISHWSGANLTEAGTETAKTLTANKKAKLPEC